MALKIDAATHVYVTDDPVTSHPVEALLQTLDESGFDGAIVVQSSRDSGYDHTYLTQAIHDHPTRLAGVCIVDPAADSAVDDLRRLVEDEGYAGMRFLTFRGDDASWFGERRLDPLWEEIDRLDIPVDVILQPPHIELVYERARQFPDVTIVLDHLALTTAEDGRDRIDALVSGAALPNVVVKISALAYLTRQAWPYSDLRDLIRSTFDAYGPERVMFGSDWPNVFNYGPYILEQTSLERTLDLDEDERAMVFGGTAQRVWSLPWGP
ncbi:MAG: amidohydrolase family protein [Actinomycetota bacterium]